MSSNELVDGNELKQLRLEAGFTQEELAERIGLSRKTINKIENNKSDSIKAIRYETIADWWDVCQRKVSQNTRSSFIA